MILTHKSHNHSDQSGFALIMALIISSVVLSIGLSMLSLTLKQIDLTTTARESEIAFQAASAGVECAQRVRFANDTATLKANHANFDCFSGGVNSLESCGTECYRHLFSDDWQGKHIKITMVILDATDASRTLPISDQRPGTNSTCSTGDVCTFIFSEGYNRVADDISDDFVFTVQREITSDL